MEEDYIPAVSPARSTDGDTSVVLSIARTHREERQQRAIRPAEKSNNLVEPAGKRIPVAVEDCKVRLNARSIFGYEQRKQTQGAAGGTAETRRDNEPDIPSRNGTPVKVSGGRDDDADDDVCIVGWTHSKRQLSEDNRKAKAEQNELERRTQVTTCKNSENHQQHQQKITQGPDKASAYKSTSLANLSSKPTTLQPYNTVTSITNNAASAKKTNSFISSPEQFKNIPPTDHSTPFSFLTSNSLTTKSSNQPHTNVFAPTSKVPNVIISKGLKSSVAPSMGKILPSNNRPVTSHPNFVPQCTKYRSTIPEEPEVAAAERSCEAVEPPNQKQHRGRTKKSVHVEPKFEVVKRKRGRPRKEAITVDEPLNAQVTGPVPVEAVATVTSSNDVAKSLNRVCSSSADQVRGGVGQNEKEKSWLLAADDEPVIKEESNHNLSDSEVDFQAFSNGINFRSTLTSTPIKECSAASSEDTKPPKKSKLRIRFKPFVEQFSYDNDSDVVLSADALANINRHTSMNEKKVCMVDRLLAQKEREVDSKKEPVDQSTAHEHVSYHLLHSNVRSVARVTTDTRSIQTNREMSTQSARTESLTAVSTTSSTRPEAHGVKMSLKPLKDSSEVVSVPLAASNTASQSTRPLPPPMHVKSIPITSARRPQVAAAQTYEAVAGNASAGAETSKTSKAAGRSRAQKELSFGRKRKAEDLDAEDDDKENQPKRTKTLLQQIAPTENRTTNLHKMAPQERRGQTCGEGSARHPQVAAQTYEAVVGTTSSVNAQKELSLGRKRKAEDLNADNNNKENQSRSTKTPLQQTAPTTESRTNSEKMAPQKSAQTYGEGRAAAAVLPNGDHVAALLDLQRKLMSVSDMSLLRQVVQIIEGTGKYRLNEATFDFDLCNLDPLTVKNLQHCLSTVS